MRPTLLLLKDAKIAKGIQRRLVLAIENSISDGKFARYEPGDTFVSVNAIDERGHSYMRNLSSLESMADKTSCKTVSIFQEKLITAVLLSRQGWMKSRRAYTCIKT